MNDTRRTRKAAPRFGVNLDHGWVSYLENGTGEPVLFLHGLNGNASSWQDQLSVLASGMKMIAWDAPGYGKSDVAGNTVEALARVAIEFTKRIWSEPVNVVGHSMGGLVAMKMAALDPALVKRLVLSCTHPGHGLSQSGGANERYRRRLEELRDLPPEVYGEWRAKGMLPDGTSDIIFGKVAKIAAESRSEGVANAAWAIQTEDLKPELTRIQAPTLVITCDQDKVAPLHKAEPLLARIPNVRHLELSGLGHAPYIEDAGRYNAAISGFLLGE
ncbi:MAG: alpha/beta hydrolase [Marinobacter sp.]|uniref:alpha/beta fold hydrolase n=1 Tax=Marinobacter sp. TaxID=50741 RepID=UPI0034A0901B